MNYIKYIKLNGEKEYKISDDGTTLLDRHMPSQGSDRWHTTTVSTSNKILSLRANYTGNNVECLLEDGKWYHISSSHGNLTLTVDELNKKHQEKKQKKETQSQKEEEKRSNWGVGALIGGAGAVIGSAKKAIKEYQAIDDISGYEASANQRIQNLFDEWGERNRRAAESEKKVAREIERRNKELEKLRAKEKRYGARDNKKRIFENLHYLFTESENRSLMFDEDLICKVIGIQDSECMAAVSCAVEGFRLSYFEVGTTEKFVQCWSEVFYLIEEGMLFQDNHIGQITKIINNTCSQKVSNESGDNVSFDDYLKMCYSKLPYAYWGYVFEKEPDEDKTKERIKYLEDNWLICEDSDNEKYNDYDDDEDDNDEDEDNDDDDEEDEEDEEIDDEVEERPAIESAANKNRQNRGSNVAQKKIVSDERYPDLQSVGFEKEDSSADLLKPKNTFDLITKGKNKQISSCKKKWNDSMWKLDHELKGKVLHEIIRIEEDAIKLVSYDDKLNALIQSGKSAGFWGFGASKEVNAVKSQMSRVKERISDHIDKLDAVLDKIEECEDNIKEYSEQLYKLTEKEKYNIIEPLDGQGISIARQLIKCKINPLDLKRIFDL